MRAAVLRRSAMLRWKHHSKNWTVKGGISETRGSLWAKPVPSRRAWKKKKKNKRQNAAPFPANERAPWTAGPACSPRTAPQLRAARPPPAGSTDRAPRGKGGASPARTAAEPRPTLGSPAPPRPHLSGFRRRGAASAARLLPRLLPERRGRRRLLRREAAAPSRCRQQPPLGARPRRGPAPARRRHVVPRGGRARTLTLAGACAQDRPEAGRPPSQQEGRDRTAGPCRPRRSRPLRRVRGGPHGPWDSGLGGLRRPTLVAWRARPKRPKLGCSEEQSRDPTPGTREHRAAQTLHYSHTGFIELRTCNWAYVHCNWHANKGVGNLFSSLHLQQLKEHRFHTTVSKLVSSSKHGDENICQKLWSRPHLVSETENRIWREQWHKATGRRAAPGGEQCCSTTLVQLLGVNRSGARMLQVLHSYRK